MRRTHSRGPAARVLPEAAEARKTSLGGADFADAFRLNFGLLRGGRRVAAEGIRRRFSA